MLTKQHYKAIAWIISDLPEPHRTNAARAVLRSCLAESNPRFDAARFLRECNAEPGT